MEESMTTFWKGFLAGLAGLLGILVGTFVVLMKYNLLETEAKAKVEIEQGIAKDAEARVRYQEQVAEVINELSNQTIDDLTAKFKEKFKVGG
jgi:xanthosine utilization system XapX-like protein